MTANDMPEFLQLLATTLAMYGKSMPEAAITKAWCVALAPYSLDRIRTAMTTYTDEHGEFPPVAAGIAKLCKLLDGRPGPEEAWAISLRSQDQADTVVWTAECAEAYALASPIMALGDEVGARMAFKEAYTRLVAAARADCIPVIWTASVGWDGARRDAAIKKAVTAGLLPAPAGQVLLGGPAVDEVGVLSDSAREQLAAIKQMVAEGNAARIARLEAAYDARIAEEAAECAERERKVVEYANQHNIPLADSSAALLNKRHEANGIASLPTHVQMNLNRLGRL